MAASAAAMDDIHVFPLPVCLLETRSLIQWLEDEEERKKHFELLNLDLDSSFMDLAWENHPYSTARKVVPPYLDLWNSLPNCNPNLGSNNYQIQTLRHPDIDFPHTSHYVENAPS